MTEVEHQNVRNPRKFQAKLSVTQKGGWAGTVLVRLARPNAELCHVDASYGSFTRSIAGFAEIRIAS